MSIIVDSVTKLYGSQKALDNVSFEIKNGEIVGFIGPNGAGKSTMMKIITGYLTPTSGSVKVNGFDVATQPLLAKKSTGYLPESNPIYFDMYVKEYLEYVAGIYNVHPNVQQRVGEVVSQTGLTPEQFKKIGELSKGYKQRVGIAQALIHEPQTLILDEPTSGLDPNQILEIRELISSTGKSKTVMLSTHIMQEVEAICDRIIIINKGKIVANESKSNIYTKATVSNTVIIEIKEEVSVELLQEIPFVNQVKKIDNNNWLLESNSEQDIRNEIFNFAVQRKFTVLSMQRKEKNLEEVFQEITTIK